MHAGVGNTDRLKKKVEKNLKFLVDHGLDWDDVDGIIKALSDKATTVGRQPVSRVDDIYTCEKSLTCDAKVTQLIELRNGRIVMTVTFTCGTRTDPVT